MRLIYVTRSLPYYPGEAFLIAELNELMRLGHEVLIVPRSPEDRVVQAEHLLPYTKTTGLLSWAVLRRAAAETLTGPGRVSSAARCPLRSRSMMVACKNFAVLPKGLWLADLARHWKADHLHCHWAGTNATMTLVASRLSGIPWSFTAHRWDIVENNLLAEKASDASFVRFISAQGLSCALAAGVKQTERVRVLHMGVPIPESPAWQPPSVPVIICPANLLRVKGHRFLIEAWRLLKQRGIPGELRIAGAGPLEKNLRSLVYEAGLNASVQFSGVIAHEELLRLYRTGAISVVVLASIDLGNGCHEGIPVALVEAMSYGIPVVATSTGAIPELILPGTGLMVPPEDPVALADAIQMLLSDGTHAKRIGYAGRMRVMESHAISQIAAELVRAFAAVPTESGSVENVCR